jgi:uncharacterized protein (TIGR03435 family)
MKIFAGNFVAVLAACFGVIAAHGQSNTQTRLKLDAASVKLAENQNILDMRDPKLTGTHVTWTTQLFVLVEYAFDVDVSQTSGRIPGKNIYTIDAVCSASTTNDQLRQMFQSLLIDRFGLIAHRGQKDIQGWAVTVAKGGAKLQQAVPNAAPPAMPSWLPEAYRNYDSATLANMEDRIFAVSTQTGDMLLIGRNISMSRFSGYLGRLLNQPVADHTNLTGNYYIAMEYAPPDPSQDSTAPSLSAAMKDLGLSLDKYKGPADMLIIDHLNEYPTPN